MVRVTVSTPGQNKMIWVKASAGVDDMHLETKDPLFRTKDGVPTAGPSDIQQGTLADCWLESALASLAATDPQFVTNMVHDDGSGGVVVHLYRLSGQGSRRTAVRTAVRVSRSLAVEPTTQARRFDKGAGGKAIWPAMVEKAWAAGRFGAKGPDGSGRPRDNSEESADTTSYDDLSWGEITHAFEVLTGKPAETVLTTPNGFANATVLFRDVRLETDELQTAWNDWYDKNYKELSAAFTAGPLKGKGGLLRQEQVGPTLKVAGVPKELVTPVSQALSGKLPGKRGTGKYTETMLRTWAKISDALSSGHPVAAQTRATEDMGKKPESGKGSGVGEHKFRGLAATHAYSVHAVCEKPWGPNGEPLSHEGPFRPSDGPLLRFVQVRNPWGHHERTYERDGAKLKAKTSTTKATGGEEGGYSWIELGDFLKRFQNLAVGAQLAAPAAEAPAAAAAGHGPAVQ